MNHEPLAVTSVAPMELLLGLVDIPEGYELRSHRTVIQDGRVLELLRFERASGINNGLGGEHFSAVVDLQERRLDGVMHVDKAFFDEAVPNEEEAREFAFKFLERSSPDLHKRAEVRWVKPLRIQSVDPPHDVAFPFHDAEAQQDKLVLGTRVKLFDPETSGFGWVISAKGGRLVAFERDVGWNRRRMCRTTEQWLHDPWVAKWGMQRSL
jgi:hypothetical protein